MEKKSGVAFCGNTRVDVVDLPGPYSLTAGSTEERIARDFILQEAPDLVVVNALYLERTLYYAAEIAAMGIDYVVALNMTDMAEDAGVLVNPGQTAKGLGVPVFPLVASKGKGLDRLAQGLETALASSEALGEKIAWLSGDLENIHKDIVRIISPVTDNGRQSECDALKLMEGDPHVRQPLATRDQCLLPEVNNRLATHPFWGVLLLLTVFAGVVTVGLAAGLSFGLFARSWFDALEAVAGRVLDFSAMPWLAWVVRGGIRGAGSCGHGHACDRYFFHGLCPAGGYRLHGPDRLCHGPAYDPHRTERPGFCFPVVRHALHHYRRHGLPNWRFQPPAIAHPNFYTPGTLLGKACHHLGDCHLVLFAARCRGRGVRFVSGQLPDPGSVVPDV